MLTLLKLQPDLNRLTRWAAAHHLLGKGEEDLGYPLHAALAAAFGMYAPKPFALLRTPSLPASLLAYTTADPDDLRDHAASFAEPDVALAIGTAALAAKQMPPCFSVGRRLGFALRARPILRTDLGGDRSRVRERDVFLAAIDGTEIGTEPDRGAVYQTWLSSRLESGGATMERLTLDAFRLSDTRRRGNDRALARQRGPDAQFSGTLRVEDPQAFGALLARGVGRHRAFGYGMLLLRPC